MSNHQFCVCHNDVDYVVVADCYFGPDTRDGDFDLCIERVYLDIDEKINLEGKDLFDNFSDADIDEMTESICDNEDLSALAYEELCDRADWLRDQRKDNQPMGD